MPISPTVVVLNALSAAAALLPNVNPPIPIYAIVESDTLFPLTIPSSWGDFDFRYETQTSDYPIESGGFAIYNKVRRPISITTTLVKTGSDVSRFAWFAAIQQQELQNPTQLYTLVTPQGVYVDYSLTGMTYSTRPDKGQNILYLTLRFEQIPQIPSSLGSYPNTLEAKSEPVSQLGQVYTNPATTAQQAQINTSSVILQ